MNRLLILIGLVVTPILAQDGDPDKGKSTAGVCQSCHMADGSGKENGDSDSWPRLAGLPAAYIEKQLHDIAEGSKVSPSMIPFVRILSEEDLVNVSAYYASLPPTFIAVDEVDPAVLAHGEKLATRGDKERYIPPCSACHGINNEGVGDLYPPLVGQHAGYIRQQLYLWQDGQRHNDAGQVMASVAKSMTKEDIEAVSLWLAAQKPQGAQ